MIADPRSPHVYLYDGVCALCNAAVQFLLKHDRHERFRFAALQSAFARETLTRHGERADDLDTFWVVRDAGTPREALLPRSRGVLFALRQLGLPWSALSFVAAVPRQVLDVAYDALARSRYRLFGRYERCVVAQPGHERRFIGDAATAAAVG